MSEIKKIKHRLCARHIGVLPTDKIYTNLIKQAILMTLKSEHVDMPCAVSVLITNDEGIKKYNNDYRGVNKPTDVLSFPMHNFIGHGWSNIVNLDIDMDTQTVQLGDIVISISTIKRNARRYGHSIEQETTRMIIHSALHLLGYDHGREMRSKELALMRYMGFTDDK
ncbi:MAG: rRNA maturation RNase YbeY [Oscillospiraceae bacterium]|nr:rRNA maturation RNase YbeY [Oscillospiraceae bacterium]